MTRQSERRIHGKVSIPTVAALCMFAAAIALTGSYLWSSRAPAPAPAGPLEQITIATNSSYVGTCAIVAARDKGFFKNEGIVAELQTYSSGKAAMAAVLQGSSNFGTVADIPVMFAGLDDNPVYVIATIFKADKDHGIVGRRDRGVLTPGSLKGKRIGVTPKTSGHFTLDAFLNRQKLSPDEVTLLNYKPEDLPNALEKGEVDAVATWEPFLDSVLERLGDKGVIYYGQDIYESLYNIASLRSYVDKHPETIKKFLRAIGRGARFCVDSPDAARALFPTDVKSEEKRLQALWPTYRFNVVLDQGLILALEDEARWAIKNKLTTRTDMPNYLNYVYLDGMEAVMPAAVTIIH